MTEKKRGGLRERCRERKRSEKERERERGRAKREKNKGNWEKKVRTTKRWEKVKKMKER